MLIIRSEEHTPARAEVIVVIREETEQFSDRAV